MSGLKSNLKIGAFIGAGHFGRVHLATDPVHGEVAVKIIVKDPSRPDPEWTERKDGLLREAQHLKKATHKNVVQVYHLVEADTADAVLYVMEFCPGGSLQQSYDLGPASLASVRKVATEITFGLSALHGRGMLHRDIKPGNVLVDAKGVAKLGDFGLVTDDLVLGYGSIAGYSDHVAPEVWHGGGTSTKTDVWALGMTIYRLLHGAEWCAESPAPRAIVKDGGLADALKWLPHVPKKWRRVIRTMLRDDPASRYQNAQQVMAALAELPVEPDWSCTVSAAQVRWERQTRDRRVVVAWNRISPKKHEWTAWSEPLDPHSGRKRTLGGSGGVVGRAAAERGLQAFFEA